MRDERRAAGRTRSALRARAAKSRRLRAANLRLRRVWRNQHQNVRILRLRLSRRRLSSPRRDPEVVVTLTSFPARIEHAWIAIETLFRQDPTPDRIVLVLADGAFPSRALPRKLVQQQRRGLEVLWVAGDSGSFDKLIPTRLVYPDAVLVTVDDDAMYAPWVVSCLTAHSRLHPGTVVGHRGWELGRDDRGPLPYVDWAVASRDTPAERVFLTGVGGVLYPPRVLPIELLADVDLARNLCPTNDDVWFWAVARVAGVPVHCLGLESCSPVLRLVGTPRLEVLNRAQGQFDVQFARVLEYFGPLHAPRTKPEPI